MRKLFLFICAVLFACSTVEAESTQALVITHVEVTYYKGDAVMVRDYVSESDIQPFMTMLRSYYPYADCAVPEYPAESAVNITVYCSGSTHTYEIRDFSYLRRDGGGWQRITVLDKLEMPLFLFTHRTAQKSSLSAAFFSPFPDSAWQDQRFPGTF